MESPFSDSLNNCDNGRREAGGNSRGEGYRGNAFLKGQDAFPMCGSLRKHWPDAHTGVKWAGKVCATSPGSCFAFESRGLSWFIACRLRIKLSQSNRSVGGAGLKLAPLDRISWSLPCVLEGVVRLKRCSLRLADPRVPVCGSRVRGPQLPCFSSSLFSTASVKLPTRGRRFHRPIWN
jgi:hypothetical protein